MSPLLEGLRKLFVHDLRHFDVWVLLALGVFLGYLLYEAVS